MFNLKKNTHTNKCVHYIKKSCFLLLFLYISHQSAITLQPLSGEVNNIDYPITVEPVRGGLLGYK